MSNVFFTGQDFNLERQGFGFVDVEWRRQGQTWAQARANAQNQLVYIPNRTYTAKSLTEALNAGIAQDYNGRLEDDGRASIMVNVEVVTGADNDPSDATVTIDAAADSQSGSPIEAVRFPDIAPYEDNYTVLLQSGASQASS